MNKKKKTVNAMKTMQNIIAVLVFRAMTLLLVHLYGHWRQHQARSTLFGICGSV